MTLPTLSKTLDPGDYAHFPDEMARVGHARNIFAGNFVIDHPHRVWEYCIALAAAGSRESLVGRRCLDVGSGYSLLPALLTWHGADVTANDSSDHSVKQLEMGFQAVRIGVAGNPNGMLRFVMGAFEHGMGLGQFDFVSCISVLEHVEYDGKMITELFQAVAPGGILVITTDFHPSEKPQCNGHNRTYNANTLEWIAGVWAVAGFISEGGFDYADRGGHVNGYNFASLVMRRAK